MARWIRLVAAALDVVVACLKLAVAVLDRAAL
jgi:hypothetical protein